MLRLCTALQKIFLAATAATYRCSLAAKKRTTSMPGAIKFGFRQRAKMRANTFSDEIGHMTKPGETFGEMAVHFAGRIGASTHLLLSLWQKTLRTELLVVPERSRSCQSVATKPGVTARAAFPAALAVPLRISSGEHFRFRLITRDRGRGATSKVAQPSAPYTRTLHLHARAPENRECRETGAALGRRENTFGLRPPQRPRGDETNAAATERRQNERRSTRNDR